MESLYESRADPVAELMLPEHAEFTSSVAPPPDVRSAVRRVLLASPTSPDSYEERDGSIRVSERHGTQVAERTCALGECADVTCGCNRLKRPKVRQRFRDGVVAAITEALSISDASITAAQASGGGGGSSKQGARALQTPVRYVTLGSGLLLTDFEILCGLVDQGLQFRHRSSPPWTPRLQAPNGGPIAPPSRPAAPGRRRRGRTPYRSSCPPPAV